MDFITFYNKNGKAIAYLSERDDETIYLFNGTQQHISMIAVYILLKENTLDGMKMDGFMIITDIVSFLHKMQQVVQ